ncbi:NAD(P)H-dependent oxidoreductase [Maritalea sp.]|jgi:putative NADPH-quinone reductase|uniref:NAD(P)H-dependent oxidoreductase n=1 Tax=Maritalea sp. TaxID=2003361 RepID=UPI0039E658D9
MKSILVLYAHPAPRHSKTNKELAKVAQATEGVTFVDLYAQYPRFKINIDKEQEQLLAHDIIIFQFPLMWYSTPSILKEWQDLVLEYGFAYGEGGKALEGKCLFPVVSVGGPETAYGEDGYNNFELRTFLTPLEQTAKLCSMKFLPPLALYSSLRSHKDGRLEDHVAHYAALLSALKNDKFDYKAASARQLLIEGDLPLIGETA